MANTPTARPLQTPSLRDEIVELRPPADSGFSGTAKFHAVDDAAMITELIRRGYAVVKATGTRTDA